MPIKQVIVMRRDLKMRRGKEIAQGSHASNAILMEVGFYGRTPSDELMEWLNTGTTKICVRVDSDQELMDIYQAASEVGLFVHLVTDAGHTEFHGVPTRTCLAIGPDHSDKIDKVTGSLPLY